MPSAASYKFGPFVVDGGAYRLLRDGDIIPLSPKIIDLLLYLAARPSALVSKDELFKALWPDVAVTDNALTQAVSELRQALGDDPAEPDLHPDRRAPRLPVHRAGRAVVSRAPPAAAAAVRRSGGTAGADGRGARFRRTSAAIASSPGCRPASPRPSPTISARATLRIIDRVRVVEAVAAIGPRPVGAARASCTSTSPSSAASSAPAIACASPPASSTPRPAKRLADAKADGPLEQVFELQDRIVAQFADALGAGRPGPARAPRRSRDQQPRGLPGVHRRARAARVARRGAGAGRDRRFRARDRLDPRYAAAHVGLGNARFWQYEMSRARNQPDAALLARAIDHVRRAIELERDLAEAHATLAFLLVSAGRAAEALAAARRAVALEPGYWGNQFRLAHAAWGEERLQALGAGDRALSGLSVRPLRGGDGAHRARRPRPRRVGAARRHDRPGPPGGPEAALSGARACTGCSAWCGWRGATPPKRCWSSSARSRRARGSSMRRSSR